MKTLQELREERKAKRIALQALKTAAFAADATDEAVSAYEAGVNALKGIDRLITIAEADEAIEGATSKAADAPAGGGDGHRTYAAPKKTVKDEQKPLFPIAAQMKAAIINKNARENGANTFISATDLLKHEGYGEALKEFDAKAREQQFKAAGGLLSTISDSVLLPQPVANEIIPILYPETTFLQGNPRRVQLIGGVYRQARGVGSATAAYVGEGAKKPTGAPTFDDIDMRAHKLAGIVYMTNEAVKWTIGRIEEFVRDDLRRVMGLKMDTALYFGTGVGATPTGIFNQPGITVIDASVAGSFVDGKAPTYTELDRIASRAVLALTGANITRGQRWRWVMGYRAKQYLADLRDGLGNAIYPAVETNNTWKGIPILVSNQIAENGGTNTDEGTIALVDFGHVLFAEEEGMTMKTSTEATIVDTDSGVTVPLWQENRSAILMEMSHDVTLDQPKSVVKITKVRWGSTSAN